MGIVTVCALDSYAFYYADKPEKIYYEGTESEWDSFNLQGILDITSVQCDYRIDITSFTIDEIPIQKYEGKPVTPKATLRNPLTGKVLIENTDYIVEYFENTDCGRAEIVVSANVIFRVVNGSWDDGTKDDKIVKKTGLLTAKKETKDGSVTITKTGSDKPIKVYITTPKLEKKKIMNAGAGPESLQLDHDRDHLKVQWYSDSPDVATVSGNGIVTPVSVRVVVKK